MGQPQGKPSVRASMSKFTDFAMASGPARVQVIQDFKRSRYDVRTDFYRPLREALLAVHRDGLTAEPAYERLMASTDDARVHRIYPDLIDGHRKFVAARPGLVWFPPAHGELAAGTGMSIEVNPELGLVIDGVRHHLKLYLRSEPLQPRRVDFLVALMLTALPVGEAEKCAVLDLRNARLHYLAEKSASPLGWRKLSALVHVEAAGYAEGWGRV